MTRKEEFKQRAMNFLADEHAEPIDLVDMLLQVEREVLERVKKRYHCHEYMSDHRTFDEWLTAQQQELGS